MDKILKNSLEIFFLVYFLFSCTPRKNALSATEIASVNYRETKVDSCFSESKIDSLLEKSFTKNCITLDNRTKYILYKGKIEDFIDSVSGNSNHKASNLNKTVPHITFTKEHGIDVKHQKFHLKVYNTNNVVSFYIDGKKVCPQVIEFVQEVSNGMNPTESCLFRTPYLSEISTITTMDISSSYLYLKIKYTNNQGSIYIIDVNSKNIYIFEFDNAGFGDSAWGATIGDGDNDGLPDFNILYLYSQVTPLCGYRLLSFTVDANGKIKRKYCIKTKKELAMDIVYCPSKVKNKLTVNSYTWYKNSEMFLKRNMVR